MCGCVAWGGVGWGGGGRSHFLRQPVLNWKEGRERGKVRETKGEEEKKEKAECFGVTILLLIALAVSVVQNMTLPSLSHDRNTGD